jgi:hypothetical protein
MKFIQFAMNASADPLRARALGGGEGGVYAAGVAYTGGMVAE